MIRTLIFLLIINTLSACSESDTDTKDSKPVLEKSPKVDQPTVQENHTKSGTVSYLFELIDQNQAEALAGEFEKHDRDKLLSLDLIEYAIQKNSLTSLNEILDFGLVNDLNHEVFDYVESSPKNDTFDLFKVLVNNDIFTKLEESQIHRVISNSLRYDRDLFLLEVMRNLDSHQLKSYREGSYLDETLYSYNILHLAVLHNLKKSVSYLLDLKLYSKDQVVNLTAEITTITDLALYNADPELVKLIESELLTKTLGCAEIGFMRHRCTAYDFVYLVLDRPGKESDLVEILEFLLRSDRLDPNQMIGSLSFLTAVVSYGLPVAFVKTLIDNGADPSIVDDQGNIAADYTTNPKILELLE